MIDDRNADRVEEHYVLEAQDGQFFPAMTFKKTRPNGLGGEIDSPKLVFEDVFSIEINASDEASEFRILGTVPDAMTTINGFGGDDAFQIDAAGLNSGVTVNGGDPKRVEESFLTVCIFVLYPSMKEDTSMDWKLSQSDRDGLQDRMQTTCDARECRRCSALLRLDQGLSVSAVAREFGVSRQTLHNWRDRFHDELSTGLKDQPRSGRPTDWSDRRVETLKKLLDDTPRQHGFHARGWTTSLLQTRLEQLLHWSVSDYSLRQQLHTLDYVWKRYRYKLKPDPLREKKKAHPQANQRLAARHGSLV